LDRCAKATEGGLLQEPVLKVDFSSGMVLMAMADEGYSKEELETLGSHTSTDTLE
jgi:hypothetical protein